MAHRSCKHRQTDLVAQLLRVAQTFLSAGFRGLSSPLKLLGKTLPRLEGGASGAWTFWPASLLPEGDPSHFVENKAVPFDKVPDEVVCFQSHVPQVFKACSSAEGSYSFGHANTYAF